MDYENNLSYKPTFTFEKNVAVLISSRQVAGLAMFTSQDNKAVFSQARIESIIDRIAEFGDDDKVDAIEIFDDMAAVTKSHDIFQFLPQLPAHGLPRQFRGKDAS